MDNTMCKTQQLSLWQKFCSNWPLRRFMCAESRQDKGENIKASKHVKETSGEIC